MKLDTGSIRMNRTFYDLVRTQHRVPLLSPSTLGLQSVTGHPLKVLGQTQIKLQDAGSIKVYVVDNLNKDLILGIDAICAGKGKIDLPSKTFNWF